MAQGPSVRSPSPHVLHPSFCHCPAGQEAFGLGGTSQKTEKGPLKVSPQTWYLENMSSSFLSFPGSRKDKAIYFSKQQTHSVRENHFFPAKPPAGLPSQLSAAHKINTIPIYPPSSKSIITWLWTNGQVVLHDRNWVSSFLLPGRKEED